MLLSNNLVVRKDVVVSVGKCCECESLVDWHSYENEVLYGECRNCNLEYQYRGNERVVKVYDANGERAKYL